MSELLFHSVRSRGLVVTARTGFHCPCTGFWSPGPDGAASVQLTRGAMMPACEGAPVSWTYQGQNLPPFGVLPLATDKRPG